MKKREEAANILYDESRPTKHLEGSERSKKEKCTWIIYNLLRIHNDSILQHPQSYIKELMATVRCDESYPYLKDNSLHRCRAQYVKRVPEETLKKILKSESESLNSEENQLVRDITLHYYEWNRSELFWALFQVDKVRFGCYLVQYPPNNGVIAFSAVILGSVLSLARKFIKRA